MYCFGSETPPPVSCLILTKSSIFNVAMAARNMVRITENFAIKLGSVRSLSPGCNP